jgi:hypothetical protein
MHAESADRAAGPTTPRSDLENLPDKRCVTDERTWGVECRRGQQALHFEVDPLEGTIWGLNRVHLQVEGRNAAPTVPTT